MLQQYQDRSRWIRTMDTCMLIGNLLHVQVLIMRGMHGYELLSFFRSNNKSWASLLHRLQTVKTKTSPAPLVFESTRSVEKKSNFNLQRRIAVRLEKIHRHTHTFRILLPNEQ